MTAIITISMTKDPLIAIHHIYEDSSSDDNESTSSDRTLLFWTGRGQNEDLLYWYALPKHARWKTKSCTSIVPEHRMEMGLNCRIKIAVLKKLLSRYGSIQCRDQTRFQLIQLDILFAHDHFTILLFIQVGGCTTPFITQSWFITCARVGLCSGFGDSIHCNRRPASSDR